MKKDTNKNEKRPFNLSDSAAMTCLRYDMSVLPHVRDTTAAMTCQ